ncbi:MAG: archease [Gammaproteobacteria bacterium]|nr:MAG: archease [Gammaproteobacteria bacterium]
MSCERPDWEHFEHGADVGVRGYGATLAEAFANAALALTAVLTEPERVAPRAAVPIECIAPDPELLLLDWLNAVIYEMATRRMLFARYDVAIDDGRLQAQAFGEPVDRQRHRPAVEVKGATLTGLSVRREPDGRWLAQCVVDV